VKLEVELKVVDMMVAIWEGDVAEDENKFICYLLEMEAIFELTLHWSLQRGV